MSESEQSQSPMPGRGDEFATTDRDLTRPEAALSRTFRNHNGVALVIATSIIATFIFAFRCFVVTDYDPFEAKAVFSRSSIDGALRSVALAVLPFLLLLIVFMCGLLAGARLGLAVDNRPIAALYFLGGLIAFGGYCVLTGFFYALWIGDLVTVGFGLACLLLGFRSVDDRGRV